ncbi:MAG: hypothetical protein JWO56_842 [Acidobacteria bacterium]|nr:hypothetical protein [Acidobacteriota bacterium]
MTEGPRGSRAFDPSAAGVVYASTFDDVQRSTDGGTTWSRMGGGMPRTHSLFTVGAGGALYLGGSSGGVFVHHFVRLRAVGK